MLLSWAVGFGDIHAASLLELSVGAADNVLARGRGIGGPDEREGTLVVEAVVCDKPIDGPTGDGTEDGGEGSGTEAGPLGNFSDEESARCKGAGRFRADALGNTVRCLDPLLHTLLSVARDASVSLPERLNVRARSRASVRVPRLRGCSWEMDER